MEFSGAGAEKLCYFRLRLRLRLQKIPCKWIFRNNVPKKQLKFPLSNNYSVQLAATILPSNKKRMKKKIFEMVVMKSQFTVLKFTQSRSHFIFRGSEPEPPKRERLRNSGFDKSLYTFEFSGHKETLYEGGVRAITFVNSPLITKQRLPNHR